MKFNMNFPQVLLLTFIILKLTHYISWSWWWILSPIWIMFIIYFIEACLESDKKDKL